MTPASGDDAYASPDQFTNRYDSRIVRQLLSDDDAPVTGSLVANAKLLSLLREASGMVESAACAGQRYIINETQNDLASLTGNSAEFLAGIVCHLAYYLLWSRRPNMAANEKTPVLVEQALDWLEAMRLGERVLGVLESHQAGHIESYVESPEEVQARNGVTVIMSRFFGRRSGRYRR